MTAGMVLAYNQDPMVWAVAVMYAVLPVGVMAWICRSGKARG